MKLSEYMRKGISLSEPLKNGYVHRQGEQIFACAIGAALLGYWIEKGADLSKLDGLCISRKALVEIGAMVVVQDPTRTFSSDQVEFIATRLNDTQDWTREAIAECLEGLGM